MFFFFLIFSFALDNGLRRVEVGTFEKSANGTIFVVRGILVCIFENLLMYSMYS